jgi:pimeloyl-ACP methyl ester carboxylesterase
MRQREVTTPDGRRLLAHDAGDVSGQAVFVFNGTPSVGRPAAPHAEDAARNGIRLVGFDRPGYGDSTPNPGRTVADVAADAAAVADALRIRRFACWGISGGGPHALACAALLPDRIAAAASLAGVAPWDAEGLDWLAGMGEANLEEFEATLQGEDALRPLLEREAEQLRSAGIEGAIEAMKTLLTPVDRGVLERGFGRQVVALMAEGVAGGVEGWLEDGLAFVAAWGFEPDRIRVPVLVWHGRQDRFVAPAHSEWLAARIPGAEARIEDGEGHLTLYERAVPAVHDWLLERLRAVG